MFRSFSTKLKSLVYNKRIKLVQNIGQDNRRMSSKTVTIPATGQQTATVSIIIRFINAFSNILLIKVIIIKLICNLDHILAWIGRHRTWMVLNYRCN